MCIIPASRIALGTLPADEVLAFNDIFTGRGLIYLVSVPLVFLLRRLSA